MDDKKKEHSLGEKIKEGVSVQEIENLAINSPILHLPTHKP